MALNQVIDYFERNPKNLFLIDGIGAMLSAFLLGVVLVKLERILGISPSTLYFLATFPILFALYDFICYQKLNNNKLVEYLKGIGVANLLYCFLTIGLSFYHFSAIKSLGWTYVLSEGLIVMLIATVEFKVSKRLSERMTNKLK